MRDWPRYEGRPVAAPPPSTTSGGTAATAVVANLVTIPPPVRVPPSRCSRSGHASNQMASVPTKQQFVAKGVSLYIYNDSATRQHMRKVHHGPVTKS